MAYEPTNYAALVPDPPSPTAGIDAFQQAQAQNAARQLAANQIQMQLRQQAMQQTALQAAIANPTSENYRTLTLVHPEISAAIKTAHDSLDEDTQRQDKQDLLAFHNYLDVGQGDKATAILQNRIEAAKRAGKDTTALETMKDLATSNPDKAKVMAGMTLATIGGAKDMATAYSTMGKEARDQAAEPGKEALTAAQAAQATAAAEKDRYITANPDQTVLKIGGTNPAPGAPAVPSASPASSAAPSAADASILDVPTPKALLAQFPGAKLTSGLRSPAHNAEVGGAPNSWHMRGSVDNPGALDLTPPKGVSTADFAAQVQAQFPSDKVLDEGTHVHIQPRAQNTAGAPAAAGQTASNGLAVAFQGPTADVQDAILSPEAVDMKAYEYLRSGSSALVNLGQGQTGTQNKSRIMDRVATMAKEAGTSNPELVARWAENKANSAALTSNTKALTAISSSEGTLNANLDFAQQLAKRGLGPSGVPLLDMPLNKLRANLGNADVKTLDNVLKTSADEYARILTMGPNGGGGATSVEATKQAQGLINNGMTLRQLTQAIGAAKTEAENRRIAYANESHRLSSVISGVPFKPEAAVGGGDAGGAGAGSGGNRGGWGKAVVVRR